MSETKRRDQEGHTTPKIDLEEARRKLDVFRVNIQGSNPPETELDRFLNGHRFSSGNGAYESSPIVDKYGNVDMGKGFDSRETIVLLNIGDAYPGFQTDLRRAAVLDGRNKTTLSEMEIIELQALRRGVHIQFLNFLKSEGVPVPDYISGGLTASEPPNRTGEGGAPPPIPPDESGPFGEYRDDGSLERFIKAKEKLWGSVFAICNGNDDELRRLEGELKSKGLLATDGSIYDALHDFFRAAGFGEAKVGFAVNEARDTANETMRLQRLSRLWRNGRWMYMNAVAPEVLRHTDSEHDLIEILCNSGPVGVGVAKENLANAEKKIVSDLAKVAIGRGWNRLTDSIRNINWGKSIHDGVNKYFLGRLREGININETERAAGGTDSPGTENGRVEILTDEKKLKLFLRERARDIIRTTSSDDLLTLNNIRDKIISGLGFDPKTFTPVNLFERLPVDRRDGFRSEFEEEVLARCTLRAAELKEWSYKAMADKGAAVNRYMNDMKGSESGGASAAVLDRDTFLWLKNLKNEGDGLTREAVDRAFSMFVMLGERDPDFSATWARPFEKYRPKKRKADGTESWGTNYYDPSYDRGMKANAVGEIESTFGKDATSLAWQMFQAFKEEGNYNWQHYLSRDFTFAASRHSLATLLTPPVYIGSRRVYETKTGTYKDELERVALSALRVKTKVGEDSDPTLDDPTKTKDRFEANIYLGRARKGAFLRESPFEDQNMVKDGRLPQQLSFNTVKDGEKFRTAIVAIGELGKDADKSPKIGAVISALSDLRNNGQSLVEAGVIIQGDLDRQIKNECKNAIWELSVENPANTVDLGTQTKAKPSFLPPSGLNTLFEKMGGSVSGGANMRYVGTDSDYYDLSEYMKQIRDRTWKLMRSERLIRSDSEDSDVGLLKKEGGVANLVLPVVRGRRVMGKYEASNEDYFDWLYRKLGKTRNK